MFIEDYSRYAVQPSHHSVFPRRVVFQLGIGDFHHFWFVDGDLLLTHSELIENLAAHHLLYLSRLRLVRSLFPPVTCVVERTPTIWRFLGLHEATYVYLKPVYLVE